MAKCSSSTHKGCQCDANSDWQSTDEDVKPAGQKRGASGHQKAIQKGADTSMQKDTVYGIFQRITGNSSKRKEKAVSVSNARLEALAGYRKSSGGSSNSRGDDKLVAVSSVVVMVCGLNTWGELKRSSVPGKVELGRMERRGCAKICMGKYDEPIEFDPMWTHEEVDNFLRELLPLPFSYADSQASKSSGKSPRKSSWLLLAKENKRLSVISKKATGKELFRYKGRDNVGFEQSHIWIALREAVPEDVYNSWGEQTDDSSEPELPEDSNKGVTGNNAVHAGKKRRYSTPDPELSKKGHHKSGPIKKKLKAGFGAVVNNARHNKKGEPDGTRASPQFVVHSDSEVSIVSTTNPAGSHTVVVGKAAQRPPITQPPEYVRPSKEASYRQDGILTFEDEVYANPWSFEYRIREILF